MDSVTPDDFWEDGKRGNKITSHLIWKDRPVCFQLVGVQVFSLGGGEPSMTVLIEIILIHFISTSLPFAVKLRSLIPFRPALTVGQAETDIKQ